jgi:hypothetical protein
MFFGSVAEAGILSGKYRGDQGSRGQAHEGRGKPEADRNRWPYFTSGRLAWRRHAPMMRAA